MEVLDGDKGKLRCDDIQAKRDIVQLVPFSKFKTDPKALAQEVLAEVPNHLISYNEAANYVPQPNIPQVQPQYGGNPPLTTRQS